MKNRSVCVLLLAAVSTLSYAQNSQGNDNGQGDQQGRPAVPKLGQGRIRPHVWIRSFIGPKANLAATTYMTPALMTAAYRINGVGSGQGATVVIVDAYDAPNVAADLASFMSTWGISCPTPGWGTFTEVNQNGSAAPLPGYDSGWEAETSMDTQWVRAIAPCANIVLVEANSNSDSDLMTAVSTAGTLGSVVSMSWGGSESVSQTSYDSFFVKNGVTFLASSGDTGGVVEWPSSSPNVIGVGGTNLNYANGKLVSETAWSGSGGGCSSLEPAIAAQTGFVPSSCKNRAAPDVSMDGGGLSPVYVLISNQGGWYAEYGTSLSVQLWAGVTALANALHGAPLNGVQSALYTDAAGAPSSAPYTSNYRDITSGSAGSFSTGPGWDFVTGLGSPLVNKLVPLLGPPTPNFSISANPSSLTVAHGSAGNSTITVTSVNGFNSPVGLTVSGCPANTTCLLNPTSVTPPPNGATTSTLTVTASGTSPTGTVSLTVSGNSGVHTTTVSLTITDFSLSASPSSTTITQGNPANSTITVTSASGYHSAVTLSVTNCPAGAVCKFATNPVTPPANGSNTSALSVTGLVAGGPYSLTISGTDGTLTHNATFNVTVSVATPTYSPAAGLYSTAQSVTISTITSGASIRYTTDGSIPTSTTGIMYGGAIMVSTTTTIRAIAYASGAPASPVASATYTIGSGPAWYDTSWTTRKQVTVDHTKVSGSSSLNNFPILVSVADAGLKSTANGGWVGKSDGTDILFTSSDGMTRLDHELESYNAATGQLIAWVRIPSLSPAADTAIYVYFGNSVASNQQNKTGVWDSYYKIVQHLPNGTTLSLSDSTTSGYGSSSSGASAGTGQIDGAATLTGGSSNITVGNGFSAISGNNTHTVSLWANVSDFSNAPLLYEAGNSADGDYAFLEVDATHIYWGYRANSASVSTRTYSVTVGPGWHNFVTVKTGTGDSGALYLDGVLQITYSGYLESIQTASNKDWFWGTYRSPGFNLHGSIDELRISNVSRSAGWITTEYNNQSNPATFTSLGSSEGVGGSQVATPAFSLAAGLYSTAQSVTISTITSGASIRYTTDGSIPTSTTGIMYGGAIMVSTTTTIRAIAYASGAPASPVASATYTIGSGPAWYDTSWTTRKQVTVDHTKVSGSSSLNNFPILVSVADAGLKSTANGGWVGKSDGTDILFTSSDGMTRLDHELESYNAATGQLIAWVRIPSLSPAADTAIYVYFGNSVASNQQNKTGVWDSYYKIVQHLPNGTTLSLSDSTTSGYGSSSSGASAGTGQIDGAATLTGGSSNITVGNGFSAISGNNTHTVSLWANVSDFSNAPLLYEAGNSADGDYAFLEVDATHIYWGYRANSASVSTRTYSVTVGPGWHNFVTVKTGTGDSGALYLDGVLQITYSGYLESIQTASNKDWFWGTYRSPGFNLHGSIDELRISNVSRSAGWITTEYNNQSNPATFTSLGSSEGVGGSQVATPTFSLAAGLYSTFQSVTISTLTSGASIRYTTDRSIPTSTTGIVYSGAIMVSSTTTIRAIAYASGAPDSAVASATYTIGSGPAWYDTSWTTRKQVTVDHTKVSGSSSLNNFPILVSVADAGLKSTANGGWVGKSDGTDILFTSSDGMTRLDHELESYNAATGQLIAWVRIPSLSPAADTAIYVYFGNSVASNQQNKTGVWDSYYKIVQHLPNGTTLSLSDSTTSGYGSSSSGASAGTGQIDGAATLTGGSSNITVGNGFSAISGNNTHTVSLWANVSDFSNAPLLYEAGNSADGDYAFLEVDATHIYWGYRANSASVSTRTYSVTVGPGWHNFVTVKTGTGDSGALYLDGVLQITYSGYLESIQTASNKDWFWGTYRSPGFNLHGSIDELRISNVSRSAGWITTEYNNQSNPATFTSLGSSEGVGGSQVATPTFSLAAGLYSTLQSVTISTTTSGAFDLPPFFPPVVTEKLGSK